jgi:hypothetical protein
MADENSLTKQDLLEALKPLATKEDVRRIVSAEITARGLATKDDLAALEKRTDGKLAGLEARTDTKLTATESRTKALFTELGDRVDEKLAGMEARTDAKLANLTKKMDEKFSDQESRLKGYVQEGVDTVVKTMDVMGKRHCQRFDKIEQELKTVNRRLLGLEQDTVSKKEFSELKSRVDSYHPFN